MTNVSVILNILLDKMFCLSLVSFAHLTSIIGSSNLLNLVCDNGFLEETRRILQCLFIIQPELSLLFDYLLKLAVHRTVADPNIH